MNIIRFLTSVEVSVREYDSKRRSSFSKDEMLKFLSIFMSLNERLMVQPSVQVLVTKLRTNGRIFRSFPGENVSSVFCLLIGFMVFPNNITQLNVSQDSNHVYPCW